MERTLIIFCFLFLTGCSERNSEARKKPASEKKTESGTDGYCNELAQNNKKIYLERTQIHWMYMDDSLRNICRPLNYRLPWMMSDIKVLPEMIKPEIARLSPLSTFEITDQQKVKQNDSIHYYHIKMQRDFCRCDVYRFYQGKPEDKNFQGFLITEQIVCNAVADENDLTNQ